MQSAPGNIESIKRAVFGARSPRHMSRSLAGFGGRLDIHQPRSIIVHSSTAPQFQSFNADDSQVCAYELVLVVQTENVHVASGRLHLKHGCAGEICVQCTRTRTCTSERALTILAREQTFVKLVHT